MKYDILDSRTKSMQDLGCCLHPKTTKMFGQERIQSFQPFPLVNLPFMCRENKVFFRPNISGPIWSCLSKIKQYIDIKELCVLCNVTATMITLSGSPTDMYLDVRSKWVGEPDYDNMTKASGFPTTKSEQAKPRRGEGWCGLARNPAGDFAWHSCWQSVASPAPTLSHPFVLQNSRLLFRYLMKGWN